MKTKTKRGFTCVHGIKADSKLRMIHGRCVPNSYFRRSRVERKER